MNLLFVVCFGVGHLTRARSGGDMGGTAPSDFSWAPPKYSDDI